MDPNALQIPHLAAVLHTLSAYAPPHSTVQPEQSNLEDGEYDPSQYNPVRTVPDTAEVLRSTLSAPSYTFPPVAESRTASTKTSPPPSASSITTWPRALSYTVQNVFSDPNKKRRIQYLIQTQHAHEKQWWASREDLVRKAQGRNKSRMQLDSVLAAVGGLVATPTTLQGEAEGDEVTKELAIFDRKVHRASREMVVASKKELRELEVPFFCSGISESFGKDELEALRSKMLSLLEDFCGSLEEEG